MKKVEEMVADEDGQEDFFCGGELSETPTSQVGSEDCSSSYLVPRDVDQAPDDDDDSVESLRKLRREKRYPVRRKRGILKKYYPSSVNQQEQPDAERQAADAVPATSAAIAAADDESSDSDGDSISDSAGEADERGSGSEGDSASAAAVPQQRGNGRYGLRAPKHSTTIEETNDGDASDEDGDFHRSRKRKHTDDAWEGEDGSLR
jgi:hypothetical protein